MSALRRELSTLRSEAAASQSAAETAQLQSSSTALKLRAHMGAASEMDARVAEQGNELAKLTAGGAKLKKHVVKLVREMQVGFCMQQGVTPETCVGK